MTTKIDNSVVFILVIMFYSILVCLVYINGSQLSFKLKRA
jgi:hypothetical protein